MAARVFSLNLGRPAPNPVREGDLTGIGKVAVDAAVLRAPGPRLTGLGSGLEGDFIGSTRHHGGDTHAVYAYSREEMDRWEERIGRTLPSGMFGENLTTAGLEVDGALIGETWSVGDEVVLEVCGPRIPCATFQARMGERGWLKRFTEVGNPGAYLAVHSPGVVRRDDPIEVQSRPDHGVDLRLVFRAFTGDSAAAERVVAAACLPEESHTLLVNRLNRRPSSEA